MNNLGFIPCHQISAELVLPINLSKSYLALPQIVTSNFKLHCGTRAFRKFGFQNRLVPIQAHRDDEY